ncbi:peptidyl-prolyl cis-trans isomerase, putative [Babesia caballi]|uniref:Peptidyl-prolyl cis-trans isomerase, putative n=1 Tax=Babesia caballi TaxID=5871 RepID=A0AAV4LNV7_BABCB|nr:peptidyl-prolyl cis-trans isomerase, putative [Babesia caballi]
MNTYAYCTFIPVRFDDPVAVQVHLVEDLLDEFVGELAAADVALEHLAHVLARDHSAVVEVEDVERLLAEVLLHVYLLVDGGGDELHVVDGAAAVRVQLLDEALHGRVVLPLDLVTLQPLDDVADVQHAVPGVVEHVEGRAERADIAVREVVRDARERQLLHLAVVVELLEPLHQVLGERLPQHGVDLHAGGVVEDPLVVEGGLGRYAVPRVVREAPRDEVNGAFGDSLPVVGDKVDGPPLDVFEDGGVVVAVEWRVSHQHDEHDDAGAPYVAALVVVADEHLRRDVIGRAHEAGELVGFAALCREAPVYDLDGRVIAHVGVQYVLGLQVSVDDALAVAVGNGRENLPHHRGRVLLAEAAALYDLVEQLPAPAHLHDEVQALLVLVHLQELDDVGNHMRNLHDGNLTLHAHGVLDVCLPDHLHRLDLARLLVAGLEHLPVAALAQTVAVKVVDVRDGHAVDERRFMDDKRSVERRLHLFGSPHRLRDMFEIGRLNEQPLEAARYLVFLRHTLGAERVVLWLAKPFQAEVGLQLRQLPMPLTRVRPGQGGVPRRLVAPSARVDLVSDLNVRIFVR